MRTARSADLNPSGSGRHARSRRLLALGSATLLTASLAACSGSDSASTDAPTLSAEEQWAESVCASTNTVQTSLDALGADLSFDPAAGDSALEQAKATLTTQATAVKSALTDLGTTIADVPVDVEGAAQVQTELSNAKASLEESAQSVVAGVESAASAETAQEFVTGSAVAVASLGAAQQSAEAFFTTISTVTSAANEELSTAFAAAPSCQAQPTPSAS